jgi:hypothetical protein
VAAGRRLLSALSAAALAPLPAAPSSPPSPPPPPAFSAVRHVVVSAGHLAATLGKLLLWGLAEHVGLEVREGVRRGSRARVWEVRRGIWQVLWPAAVTGASHQS